MKPHRDGDRLLQLLIFNEECLVSASHQLALITSLPFVHTARRSYRLDVLVKRLDWRLGAATRPVAEKFVKPSHLEEGEVVTRFPFARSHTCRSLSRPKGCPPRLSIYFFCRTKNNERAERASLSFNRKEGDTVKLRGCPHDSRTPSGSPKGARGRGNDPGYGNSVEKRRPFETKGQKWVIRSQVLPFDHNPDGQT